MNKTSVAPRFAIVCLLCVLHRAYAVPSFSEQTGMSCIACHSNYEVLTEYGRNFKLDGYSASSGDNRLLPLAAMIQPSFTETNKSQAGGAAPHFGPNANFAITQASLFYAAPSSVLMPIGFSARQSEGSLTKLASSVKRHTMALPVKSTGITRNSDSPTLR